MLHVFANQDILIPELLIAFNVIKIVKNVRSLPHNALNVRLIRIDFYKLEDVLV